MAIDLFAKQCPLKANVNLFSSNGFWNEVTNTVYNWIWPETAFSSQNNELNSFLFHDPGWIVLMEPQGENKNVTRNC